MKTHSLVEAIRPHRRNRILNDIDELAQDAFRGLVKPVSGRYRIIFKPTHATQTVEVRQAGYVL